MIEAWKKRRIAIPLAVVALGALAVGGWLVVNHGGDFRAHLDEFRSVSQAILESVHPAIYFLAFAVTPAFGAPVSLFYLTAATALAGSSNGLAWSLLLSWLAVGTNIAIGYWIASGFMNPVISKILQRRGYAIPVAAPENEGRIILVCRISPLPFPVQNWVLGIARFRFWRYLLYSWPIQAGIATGVILVGDSLFRGGIGIAIFGVFLICLFLLIARIARKRYGENSEKLKC